MGESSEQYHVSLLGRDVRNAHVATNKIIEASSLMKRVDGQQSSLRLDAQGFKAAAKVLQAAWAERPEPITPKSPHEGVICGWLVLQGKRGWKRRWFVFVPPYLYKYKSDALSKPKTASFVSYVMAERPTEEELSAERMGGIYSDDEKTTLEGSASSLRMYVFTSDKHKVLAATSESTLEEWLSHLQASVTAHTPPEAMEAKAGAARLLRPLMLAQMHSEGQVTFALRKKVKKLGHSSTKSNNKDDPRRSKRMAKGGKLRMLQQEEGDRGAPAWHLYYLCIVDTFIYYFRSSRQEDEADDNDSLSSQPAMWKGCINLQLASVGLGPPGMSDASMVIQIATPLRTFVLKAKHDAAARDWITHIEAAQENVPLHERGRSTGSGPVDPYNDPLANKLQQAPKSVGLTDVLFHPIGNFYLASFIEPINKGLAAELPTWVQVALFKAQRIPDLAVRQARKVYSKRVKGSSFYDQRTKLTIEQMLEAEAVDAHLFDDIERSLAAHCEPYFEGFLSSSRFQQLLSNLGPKYLRVTHQKDASYLKYAELKGELIVGRLPPRPDGRTYLQLHRTGDGHQVSREHCRLDAGALAVIVTDLGSHTGTNIKHSEDGKKRPMTVGALTPGACVEIGGYILSFHLGEVPSNVRRRTSEPVTGSVVCLLQ